jgi:hypothetical protein
MQTAIHQPITLQRISILYETREEIIQELSAQRTVSLADASGLDRNGLCRLADDHWSVCTEDLRQAMLNHKHHFVRSCAAIAHRNLTKANDGVVKTQTQDELKLRLRDLCRQAAEMEANPAFQNKISVPNSPENQQFAALNVALYQVRHRLKHHFGFVDASYSGNWLV